VEHDGHPTIIADISFAEVFHSSMEVAWMESGSRSHAGLIAIRVGLIEVYFDLHRSRDTDARPA
jgi:hypothetical protein